MTSWITSVAVAVEVVDRGLGGRLTMSVLLSPSTSITEVLVSVTMSPSTSLLTVSVTVAPSANFVASRSISVISTSGSLSWSLMEPAFARAAADAGGATR